MNKTRRAAAPRKRARTPLNARRFPSRTEVEFVAKFLLLFAALFLALKALPMQPLLSAIAGFEGSALSLLGVENVVAGSAIYTHNAGFIIVPECSGLVMGALLAALVYATNVRRRGRVLLLCVPALFAFNLVRLGLTIYSGAVYGQQALDLVHALLWFVDTGVVFLIWTRVVSPSNPLGDAGAALARKAVANKAR